MSARTAIGCSVPDRATETFKVNQAGAAENLWVPAVNKAGIWGRWAFIEIRDPWDAKKEILSHRNG